MDIGVLVTNQMQESIRRGAERAWNYETKIIFLSKKKKKADL